jgi:hypothetical protein
VRQRVYLREQFRRGNAGNTILTLIAAQHLAAVRSRHGIGFPVTDPTMWPNSELRLARVIHYASHQLNKNSLR